MFFDTQTLRVLEQAQALAKKNADKFVSLERILCALATVKSDVKNILDRSGVSMRPWKWRSLTLERPHC